MSLSTAYADIGSTIQLGVAEAVVYKSMETMISRTPLQRILLIRFHVSTLTSTEVSSHDFQRALGFQQSSQTHLGYSTLRIKHKTGNTLRLSSLNYPLISTTEGKNSSNTYIMKYLSLRIRLHCCLPLSELYKSEPTWKQCRSLKLRPDRM